MAPRIKMIVILNLLWGEFAETNERRFDLLLQILNNVWSKHRSFVSTNSLQSLKFLSCYRLHLNTNMFISGTKLISQYIKKNMNE